MMCRPRICPSVSGLQDSQTEASCTTPPTAPRGGDTPCRALPSGIAVDPRNGDIVVTGSFTSFTDFGAGCVTAHAPVTWHGESGCTRQAGGNGYTDMFVARYTKNGALVWARSYGVAPATTRGWAAPNAIAVDPSGNAVVTGQFTDSVNLGSGTLTSAPLNGGRGVFVASYSAAGTANWTKAFWPVVASDRDAFADSGSTAVAVDLHGNVGITGFFKGVFNLPGIDKASTDDCPTPKSRSRAARTGRRSRPRRRRNPETPRFPIATTSSSPNFRMRAP